MFLFRFSFGTVAVLFLTLALALLGVVTAGAAALGWAAAAVTLLGLMMVADPQGGMRRTGAAVLGVVALGIALFVHLSPAHASAAADISGALITRPPSLPTVSSIAAPPGDDGFWTGLNGYLAEGVAALVAALAAWALKEIATHTRLEIRTDQEGQIRETMKTGAFWAMEQLELRIDQRWTPEQRRKLVGEVIGYAQDRAAAQLRKLGLPAFVVNAMASKVVGGLVDAYPFLSVAEPVHIVSVVGDGNSGSTPALDRAVGGNGGN